MDVGIRELKARLSHYVKAANAGEQIVVTDRGVAVAVLVPPTTVPSVEIPPQLSRMIAEGRATAAKEPFTVVPVPAFQATRTVEEILAEDRDED